MTLCLCMVIKNEGDLLGFWMPGVRDLFDEFVVVDTGSTDKTVEILKTEYGARVIELPPNSIDPFMITHARNVAISEASTEWVLVLDADESVSRSDILKLKDEIARDDQSAYFLVWRNRRNGIIFDDYKLVAFRQASGILFEGMVHCNTQRSARRLNVKTGFLSDVVIHHSLDGSKASRDYRSKRLERYIALEPDNWRYQWFLGYAYFQDGDFEKAVPLLRDTCNAMSEEFPVESLNAHFVLTDLNARKGLHDKCFRIMKQAKMFYDQVRDDFEVRVNHQMNDWIDNTRALIDNHELEKVKSCEFGY
jgi:glycosyltransferase involved in cell wall biosynthesis